MKTSIPAVGVLGAAVNSHGAVILTAMTAQQYTSVDFGKTYNVSPLYGISQSTSFFGEDNKDIGIVGTFIQGRGNDVSGVAVSSNNGTTFDVYAAGVDYPRYGAFPSAKTWFVSAGIWPESASAAADKNSRRFNSRMNVHKSGAVFSDVHTNSGDNGWFASVAKTSDGGATFKEVLRSPDNSTYYFNAISCSSETHCVVVGEGDDSNAKSGSQTVAFTTTNGGDTWVQTLQTDDYSLIGKRLLTITIILPFASIVAL